MLSCRNITWPNLVCGFGNGFVFWGGLLQFSIPWIFFSSSKGHLCSGILLESFIHLDSVISGWETKHHQEIPKIFPWIMALKYCLVGAFSKLQWDHGGGIVVRQLDLSVMAEIWLNSRFMKTNRHKGAEVHRQLGFSSRWIQPKWHPGGMQTRAGKSEVVVLLELLNCVWSPSVCELKKIPSASCLPWGSFMWPQLSDLSADSS